MTLRRWALLALATAIAAPAFADGPDKPQKKGDGKDGLIFGLPTGKASAGKSKKKPPPYRPFKEVAEGTKETPGLFPVHYNVKEHRGFLEVPARMLNRPFLLATSFSGGTTYAGWQWSDNLLYFKKHKKKLLLIEKNVNYRGSKGSPVGEVVARTYTDTLITSTRIATRSRKGGYLLSLNDLLASGAGKFFGGAGGVLDSSLAVFPKIKGFPKNSEIAVTMPQRGGGAFVTLHYSLRALPTDGYQPRKADDRIGYFLTSTKDFDKGPVDDNRVLRFINRWNLQKLDPKLKASPVKEPIVFYIEKTVPVKFRRYVREGILEWNKAYEKLGFLNAVQVRQQTATNEFKDFDPEDARYNFFRWIASEQAFAMGPSRVNPLTGQILDADIIMDDSMVYWALGDYENSVRNPTPVKDGAPWDRVLNEYTRRFRPEPRKPQAKVSDFEAAVARQLKERVGSNHSKVCLIGKEKIRELALARLALNKPGGLPLGFLGQFIKETVMHEVGHTLGLRHNFVASTWLPLEKINSKEKPLAISGSVMDYNPVNVAAPGQPQGYYQTRTLGPYDFWAIAYGYTDSKNPKTLNEIAKKVAAPGHGYATDEDASGPDPYVNRWDFGQDPLDFAQRRVRLADKLLGEVETRALVKGKGYARLRAAFNVALSEYSSAAHFSARFIGGVRKYRDHYKDPNGRDPIQPVPAAKQRAALIFITQEIFGRNRFRFNPTLLRKLGRSNWGWNPGGTYPIHDQILNIQERALGQLTDGDMLQRLIDTERSSSPSEDVLTIPELFETLNGAIFDELAAVPSGTSTARDPYISGERRNLQRSYIETLITMALETSSWTPQAAKTFGWYQLKRTGKMVSSFLKTHEANLDPYTLAHLEEADTRIEKALQAAYQLGGDSGGGFSIFSLFGKNGRRLPFRVEGRKIIVDTQGR